MKILKDYVAPILALLAGALIFGIMLWFLFAFTVDGLMRMATAQSAEVVGDERNRGITNNIYGDSMDEATARKFDIIEYETNQIGEGK